MVKNKLYVILHGHFYQPPREDPWTGEIDHQPSAYPFHDWNERINKECYAANAASRVLDSSGRIDDIINNYESISFNFGPTLINWLKKNDTLTFRAIVDADRKSMSTSNGHGNAIAQVYNHIIMPLANDQDIITEIEWGLASFKRDFGRDAEGIWLAETAINDHVAEYLIEYGLKFIILSPTQAKDIRPFHSGDHNWQDVSNNNIDPSKPYLLQEKNGSIAVFFYYGDIATKLSFEHLLRNVSFIRNELIAHNHPEKDMHLVHVATDGETYGHHEPFGDMCLSRLIFENREKKDFQFTNYGRFLELYPPQDFVRLKEGNDGLGTAWSCSHGVDRWRKDCGCSTGGQEGWNQKWRESLRNAFDFLRDRLFESAQAALPEYLKDFWEARNDYISIILSDSLEEQKANLETFFHYHSTHELSPVERTFVLKFMEALHNALLMYTSCGWFFSEISGIETLQDLKYALRVLELTGDILPQETTERFLDNLMHAKSNIVEFQNGKWIFENNVMKYAFTEKHVINEYLLTILLTEDEMHLEQKACYYYYCITLQDFHEWEKENWKVYKFVLRLGNHVLMEEENYACYIFRKDDDFRIYNRKYENKDLISYIDKIIDSKNVQNTFHDLKEWFPRSYSLNDLTYDAKEKLLKSIFVDTMKALHQRIDITDSKLDNYLSALDLYQELGVRLPDKELVAMKELINNAVLNELEKIESIDITEFDFSGLIKIIQATKRSNLFIDYADILPLIRNYVLKRMNQAVMELNIDELRHLEKVIDFTNIAGIDFEKYEIQNLLFNKLNQLSLEEHRNNIHPEVIACLITIAAKFNIATHRFESDITVSQ